MQTVMLNAYSGAFPSITNRIQARVYKQSSPLAIVASITDEESGHPARIWSFPGLVRTNYIFKLVEIDGDDNVVNQLAYFDVVPGSIDGFLTRSFEQVQVDSTPGLVSGTNTFRFDGSGSASTLELGSQGNTSASRWYFTLKGAPVIGDVVNVDYTITVNDVDPPVNFVISSTFEDGWTLDDMINDLKDKAYANNPNVTLYTDGDGNNGIRISGFDAASGNATIVKYSGDARPDWRGWEINIAEIAGTNFLVELSEYTWDSATGVFTSTIPDWVFAPYQWYNVQFTPRPMPSGGVEQKQSLFDVIVITENTDLTADDFGKKIIAEPEGTTILVTLPALETTVENLPIYFEVGNANKCMIVEAQDGELINWLRGKLIALSNESFAIYKFARDETTFEWRVYQAYGNYANVGQIVSEDFISTGVINKALLNGASVNKETNYYRLYNEFVLNLPIGQVVNYDDWATGNNKYFYSLANSANPANENKFHLPDRRGTFEKFVPSTGGKAGDFSANSVGKHRHFVAVDVAVNDSRFPSERGSVLTAIRSIIRQWTKSGGGAEGYILDSNPGEPTIGRTSEAGGDTTQPDNILVNKYVIL